MRAAGLSHSEIHGSKPACGSPWLIATYYVLHRLLAPRHSPFALSSLITKVPIDCSMELSELYCPDYLPMCSCQRTWEPASGVAAVCDSPKSFKWSRKPGAAGGWWA